MGTAQSPAQGLELGRCHSWDFVTGGEWRCSAALAFLEQLGRAAEHVLSEFLHCVVVASLSLMTLGFCSETFLGFCITGSCLMGHGSKHVPLMHAFCPHFSTVFSPCPSPSLFNPSPPVIGMILSKALIVPSYSCLLSGAAKPGSWFHASICAIGAD